MKNFKQNFIILNLVLLLFPLVAQGQHRTNQSINIPADWHHRLFQKDSIFGIGTYQAYELLRGRVAKKVIVAVLDSGTDIDHCDLKSALWINKGEIPFNGKDDDSNGYVDDIHGWNFLGSLDGKVVIGGEREADRVFFASKDKSSEFFINKVVPESKYGIAQKEYKFNQMLLSTMEMIENAMIKLSTTKMQSAAKNKSATKTQSTDIESREKRFCYGDFLKVISNIGDFEDLRGKEMIAGRLKFEYMSDTLMTWDCLKRKIASKVELKKIICDSILLRGLKERDSIGDGYNIYSDGSIDMKVYGNPIVKTSAAFHGTHVAGIIGAVRNNSIGIDGVADCVEIMTVRVVPNGDEYDKDIARGIIYAVDNGAKIINASFGKYISPDKHYVDEALKYAESKGVLFIHAAGNDAKDIDNNNHYPTRECNGGDKLQNYLNVGASTMKGAAAPFSNYGKSSVDIFAPGFFIYSTQDGGLYKQENGTSMAAPMVSGAAALLMGYFPNLKPNQVKEILLKTASDRKGTKVRKPSATKMSKTADGSDLINFEELCSSGGILNLYSAVKYCIDNKY